MGKIKVSDYIIKFIQSKGVNDVFMFPGGGCIHLVDSVKKNNMNYVINLHQQASSIAAEAYAQYTNNFGFCLVTTGPGATNAITGCAGAWLQSSPVIFISGQVQRKDMAINNDSPRQFGFQQINIVDMVKPITKYAKTIKKSYQIDWELQTAFYLMKEGRPGPVWLDIPLDIQSELIWEKQHENSTFSYYELDSQIIEKIVQNINNAKKPIILVGNGVRLSGSIEYFLRLLDKLQIPLLTTWKTIDFVQQNHPLFIGRPGITAQYAANVCQQQADLILCLGCRLDLGQIAFNQETFGHNNLKIIVDIDEYQLNKLNKMNNTLLFKCDVKDFILKLLYQYDFSDNFKWKNWLAYCKNLKQNNPVCKKEYYDDKNGINNYAFINQLSDILPDDAIIVVSSSGCASEVTFQSFKTKKGQRIFATNGLGAMGFAIPAAIGACVASGYKNVYCIEGDGSFALNIQELETIKRLNLPIKIFILNNQGYVSIRNTQDSLFDKIHVGSDINSGLSLPDICRQAQAYEINYTKIRWIDGLKVYVNQMVNSKNPQLCEIIMEINHKTLPHTIVKKDQNGEIYTLPMEFLND